MKYSLVLAVLCLSTLARADDGIRARIQLKVFEGPVVMMYERNLSTTQVCNIGLFKSANPGSLPVSLGSCSIELTDIRREKKSGMFQVALNCGEKIEALFSFTALANGYIGGGQDGPYFFTRLRMTAKSSQDFLMNLGFTSKTPEIAQDYLVRVEVQDIQPCKSQSECSL
jgi:hypothetical protein